ncbi:hypothetical protein EDB80DRAFT_687977 [Ilyonectria destructans]|nr:hypothetical protein EDB80DRAFT_687977 [Ilyonectria destructans]
MRGWPLRVWLVNIRSHRNGATLYQNDPSMGLNPHILKAPVQHQPQLSTRNTTTTPSPIPSTTMAAEDETQTTAKSAEDRKAASALASLDADESAGSNNVDHDAASKAMKALGGAPKAAPAASSTKNVKVDPADVALLVEELELPKPKATELLKSHEGNAVKAMRAYIAAA